MHPCLWRGWRGNICGTPQPWEVCARKSYYMYIFGLECIEFLFVDIYFGDVHWNAGTVLCSTHWMDHPISTVVFLLELYDLLPILMANTWSVHDNLLLIDMVILLCPDLWDICNQRWRWTEDRRRIAAWEEYGSCRLLHVWKLLHGIYASHVIKWKVVYYSFAWWTDTMNS